MFPNVRLLIGALFITVAVLSCEFAVFAALRVNREPLSRLTSESAPLQLVAGRNAPVPISWSAPRNPQALVGGAQIGAATVELPAAQPAERAIETPAPNEDATGTLDNAKQAIPAALQTALAPSPAAPAPGADVAAPIAQAPTPPPANSPAGENVTALTNPDAAAAPAQELSVGAVAAAIDSGPPEQAAAPAALAAVPAQQTPAAEIVRPAESQPAQAASAAQPGETAAQAGEPPASSAPVIAAIAPAAGEPAATPPAEITGSVPNAAMPERAVPKAAAPHAKPLPKIVRKPAVKKPHQVAHAPTQPHHAVKKRIARRARTPAAAASAQPGSDFNNPVFQSAPEFQRPTKSRPGAKKTVTNNGFNTFGAQFGTQ